MKLNIRGPGFERNCTIVTVTSREHEISRLLDHPAPNRPHKIESIRFLMSHV